ncbi:MAG: hypothetical protein ACP5UL_05550 [Thermoplasmata archaeon]
MIDSDTNSSIESYMDRIPILKHNLECEIRSKHYFKASEHLWGIWSTYINVYSLMVSGKACSTHDDIVKRGIELAKLLESETINKAVRYGNTLHANFYHSFLEEDEFKEKYTIIFKAIEEIDQYLRSLQ